MKLSQTFIRTFVLLLTVASLTLAQQSAKPDFLTAGIDKSVNPGVDFFKFATGTWMKNNPIPASERGWGIGNLVQEETYTRLRTILEEAAFTNAETGSATQKIGDYYATGMDTVAIERQGISGLEKEFSAIAGMKTSSDLLNVIADLQIKGVNALFAMTIDQDAKNSDVWALYLWQGGLGLPQRDYYFRNDARTENIRNEYAKHIGKILELTGEESAKAAAEGMEIFTIEKFLADSSRKLEDLRDPYLNYHKMTYEDVSKLAPSFDWKRFFEKVGVHGIDSIIVGQPEFIVQVGVALNKFSMDQWKTYLRWHLVNAYADKLNSAIAKERFHFRGTIMSGVKEQRPRWKRMQDAVENEMGELLGKVYVQKYYSAKTKLRYEKLVSDIIDAYRERIVKLDWMSAGTKERALVKLNSISRKVGYPDKWKDFTDLQIDRNSFVRNTINADIFWFNRNIKKLGTSVDRTEWNMSPQTYNAYYNPSNNEIVLPAAIFIIPGVPDSLIDDAVVYSYAGASTIGHELTHGFDDQGRQYDEKGNLNDWWVKEDEEKFTKKAQLMIDQFDNYVVLDSMHVNGKATVGENIADLGGLVIGLDAFKKTQQYTEGKLVNGYTPEQRFWLGYAYSWLGHKRDEALAQQIMVDVHAPEFLRINGPLSDIVDFYKAFGVKEGQLMYREANKRVEIW